MFTEIHWLSLLLPAIFVVYLLKSESRVLNFLRIVFVLLVILGLARPVITTLSSDGTLIVVADRSSSMPRDKDASIREVIDILKRDMPENTGLGLVTFGAKTKVELAPSNKTFSGHMANINPHGSNLADGLERALSLIPSEGSGRILVLSDGRWTGRKPEVAATKAALRDIPIDFRYLAKDYSGDLAVTNFTGPQSLWPEEAFLLRAEVYSPLKQGARIYLYESGRLVESHRRRLEAGYNNFAFALKAKKPDVLKYKILVKPDVKDEVLENNESIFICDVVGKKPVLVLSESGETGSIDLLKAGKLEFVSMKISEVQWGLEFMSKFSAIVLDNLSADRIGLHGMQLLKGWVKHLGGGLVVLGGVDSYGNGGYFRSPLEDALPVSAEIRTEHRKMALAMMIVLDRSGSMTAPTQGGRTKMDLANLAAAGVLDFLSPNDHLGVMAVDTKPHVVVEFGRLGDSKEIFRDKILSIESMGGGIYVYDGILSAVERLMPSPIRAKHIILFADASDAEKPGEYWELLDKATRAGITLSAIGLGTENDCDAEILRKVAAAGKGRIFFARDPEELPRLFLQDVFVVAKSSYIEEKINCRVDGAYRHLFPNLEFEDLPFTLGAYNLTYLKQGAFKLASTLDEDSSPILSYWQYGLGGVVCLATDFGREAGEEKLVLRDERILELMVALTEQISLDDSQSLGESVVTQSIKNGFWQVRINLDPERPRDFLNKTPKLLAYRLFDNHRQEVDKLEFSWETADSLVAGLQLEGNEVVTSMVDFEGLTKTLPATCQPYSPEYKREVGKEGLDALKGIAQITNGREVFSLSNMWESLPLKYQHKDLGDTLLGLAIFVFFLELLERRLSALTVVWSLLRKKGFNRKLFEGRDREVRDTKFVEVKDIGDYKIEEAGEALAGDKTADKEEKSAIFGVLKQARDNIDRRI